jgi:hypothetical protein
MVSPDLGNVTIKENGEGNASRRLKKQESRLKKKEKEVKGLKGGRVEGKKCMDAWLHDCMDEQSAERRAQKRTKKQESRNKNQKPKTTTLTSFP